MKKTSSILLQITSLLMLLLWSSCANYYYVPPPSHSLRLQDAKDFKSSIGVGMSGENALQLNMQVGYSPIKHLALSSTILRSTQSDNKINLLEGAIGTYYFSESGQTQPNTRNGVLFDLYAGYGKGRSLIQNLGFNTGDLQLNSNKYYIQGGMHLQYEVLVFSTTYRRGILDYSSGFLYGEVNNDVYSDLTAIDANDPYAFNEIGVKLELGPPKLRCFFGLSHIDMPKASFNYHKTAVQLGLVFDFKAFKRNIQKKDALEAP